MSPTARSLAHLRKQGAIAAVVERFNPGARVRQDLFGFIDIVALEPAKIGVLAVQACVTGDQSKRLQKIREEPRALAWLAAGNRIAVYGWAKRGARGKRKLWTLSETPYEIEVGECSPFFAPEDSSGAVDKPVHSSVNIIFRKMD